MKSKGWSSKAKKSSTAYLAFLTAKKAKKKVPKLWTGLVVIMSILFKAS